MTQPIPRDLREMMDRAKAKYDALSPVDKALADSAQRRMWVQAETGRDPGDVLEDEVRRLREECSRANERTTIVSRQLKQAWHDLAEAQRELNNRHERLFETKDYHDLHDLVEEVVQRATEATGSTSLRLQGRIIRHELFNGFRAKKELIAARREVVALKHDVDSYVRCAGDLATELADARSKCIAGFYEDEVPTFTQGAPTHEIQEYVDAEEVTGYVAEIQRLRAQLKRAAQLASIADDCNIYDIQLEGEEWTDTMSLYHEFLAAAEGKA